MAKIGIVCKTSFSQGMGHLVRQTHIAKILRKREAEIIFFIPDYLARPILAGSVSIPSQDP